MDADRQWKGTKTIVLHFNEGLPSVCHGFWRQRGTRDWDENEEKNMKGKEKMHACVPRERERGGLFGRGGCYLRGAGLAKQESSLLANEFKERSRCHRSERDHLRKLKHPQWKERNELCAVKSAVAISSLSSNRARSLVPPRFLRLSAGSISIGKTCMLYRCW